VSKTALSQYTRLESLGVWTPEPGGRKVNVLVSFGAATLVISDQRDHPLSHWSLAAVVRVNPGERPALFAPSAAAAELLEIEDPDMIAALETVRKAVLRGTPRGGRLRRTIAALLVLAVAVGVFAFGPNALVRHAERTLPDAARAEIGAGVLQALHRVAGAGCTSPEGDVALQMLQEELPGLEGQRLQVLPQGPGHVLTLPGGWFLLERRMVEEFDTAEVAAGHLLAAQVRKEDIPPLRALLEEAGSLAVLQLLTTGQLPPDLLRSHAETLMRAPPAPVQEAALLQRFAEAGITARPYAFALDITGETTLGLIEADSVRPDQSRRLLRDRDWLALQGICE
jgi:hypothetical protein